MVEINKRKWFQVHEQSSDTVLNLLSQWTYLLQSETFCLKIYLERMCTSYPHCTIFYLLTSNHARIRKQIANECFFLLVKVE